MDAVIHLGDAVLAFLEGLSGRVSAVFSWYLRLRWWLRVTIVWALSRVFSVAVVLVIARQQGPNPWTTSSPGYFQYADGWDAQWYNRIFDHGYPLKLPVTAAGAVKPNEWAFYPVFPYAAKAINLVTGLSFEYIAPILATLASLALCLVLYRLFRTRASAAVALTGVTLFSVQPASPILQFGYAESFGLLMLAGVLLLVIQRRFLLAIPLTLLLSVTRPTNAPLALGLLLVLVGWFLSRRRSPVQRGDWSRMIALIVATGIGVLIWPIVVTVATGDPHAYFATEASWHGKPSVIPGELWAVVGIRLFGHVFGLLAPVVFIVGLALIMLTKTVRRIGGVLWLFTASYVLYLVGVSAPNGSIFRLFMPAFPLMLAAAMASNSRAYRVTLIALSMVLQVVWVAWLWQWTGVGLHGAVEVNP